MSHTKNNKSNPETSTPDSWESRITSAATFMGIKEEEVLQALKELGVEKETRWNGNVI